MSVIKDVYHFYSEFKGLKGVLGKTFLDKPIIYFCIRHTARPVIIAQYAIHAREYITSWLALKQLEEFEKEGKRGCVYFIPAVNVDGIEICLNKDPLYKANARGVDLNVNFDARWGTGESNVHKPSSQNYIGKYPFSEPETRALRDFTLSIRPNATLSYHSKGEEIYWQFFQSKEYLSRDYAFASAASKITGYSLKSAGASAGGYKDWCIQNLKIPALTIEVGDDKYPHPLKKEHLPDIYSQNRGLINTLIGLI